MTNPHCPACGEIGAPIVRSVAGYDIHRCATCALRYVPVAGLHGTVDYDELYQEGGLFTAHVDEAQSLRAGQRPRFARARRSALQQIRALRLRTLLEVGCGTGAFLSRVVEIGVECYGTDLSAEAIRLARAHLDSPLHVGPLDEEVFPGMRFDAVCSWEVLEHVTEPGAFLGSLVARLNPGGHLFLSTPNYESRWLWDGMEADPRSQPPVHLTFWDATSIRQFLERFELADIVIHRYSVPANAAQRISSAFFSYLVYPDALLRPSQRTTLLAHGRKVSEGSAQSIRVQGGSP